MQGVIQEVTVCGAKMVPAFQVFTIIRRQNENTINMTQGRLCAINKGQRKNWRRRDF